MILRLERCGMKFAHIGDLHIGKRVHDFSMLEEAVAVDDTTVEFHLNKPFSSGRILWL